MALDSLHAALAIQESPPIYFAIARIHDDADHHDLALAWYSLCVGPDADADTRKRADKRIQALGAAGLRVNIVEFKLSPENADLLIDGTVWSARLGRVLSVSLGDHKISVRAPGFEPASRDFVVVGPMPQIFEVTLTPVAVKPEEVSGPTLPPPPTRMNDGPGVLPWVVAGVGLGVVTLGTVLVIDGDSDWEKVRTARSDLSLTREQADSLVADGKLKRTLGFTSVGVGGAMIVSGLLWYALWEGDDAPAVVFVPGLSSAKINLTGKF